MSDATHKRLLIEFHTKLRHLNREVINPAIPELKLEDLSGVMNLVARARAKYLTHFFTLAEEVGDGMPSADQIKSLRSLHAVYEELVGAAQEVEVAIERGYLDVQNQVGQAEKTSENVAREESK